MKRTSTRCSRQRPTSAYLILAARFVVPAVGWGGGWCLQLVGEAGGACGWLGRRVVPAVGWGGGWCLRLVGEAGGACGWLERRVVPAVGWGGGWCLRLVGEAGGACGWLERRDIVLDISAAFRPTLIRGNSLDCFWRIIIKNSRCKAYGTFCILLGSC